MLLANQEPAEGQIFGWGETLGMPSQKAVGGVAEGKPERLRLLGLNGVGGDVLMSSQLCKGLVSP